MYVKPGATSQWTEHKPLYRTQTTLVYGNDKGQNCNPPKQAIKISRQSETEHTIVMRDSNTEKVHVKNHIVPEEKTPTRDALLRAMGPDVLTCGDEREIVKALEDGTLQGALDESLKTKQEQAYGE